MMNEDIVNDPDEQFTEKLLRKALGPKFSLATLQRVQQAEKLLIDNKDKLTDLVIAGVMTEEQFTYLANRALSVYLRTVGDIVGEDACRKMYDFGPDDEVHLVNRNRAVPKSLSAIVRDELILAGESVSVQGDENDFNEGLRATVQFVVAKGELMLAGHAASNEVGCWQASMLAIYLANHISGEGVAQLIWRVCEKIMLLGDCCLQALAGAIGEFYRLCRGTQMDADGDGEIYVKAGEGEQIEKWLSDHCEDVSATPFHDRRI